MTTEPVSKPTDHRVVIDHEASRIELRQSAISTFLDCRRRFYWEYIVGLEPDYPTGYRPWTGSDTGTAVHLFLGAAYTGDDLDEALASWLEDPETRLDPDSHEAQQGIELARIMVDGHLEDLAQDGADAGETTLGVEVPVEAEVSLDNGWTVVVHGRIDRLIELDDGRHLIDDWKTVGTLESAGRHIPQLGRYAVLLRASTGVKASRVRTTQIKRVKRTKGGPFYARPWVALNEQAYRSHANSLRAVLTDLVQCVALDQGWYERVSSECSWKCHVESLCVGQQHGDDIEMIVDLHYRKKGTA